MKIKIRKATIGDLAEVQKLNHDLFISDSSSDDQLNLDWPFLKDGEDYFRSVITGDLSICLIAEANGAIVGYLAGSLKSKEESYRPIKVAELDNMLVLEGHRSKGVGTQLVETFLKWCKENKAVRVKVRAYAPNKRAIKFYKRVGFKPYVTELEYKTKLNNDSKLQHEN